MKGLVLLTASIFLIGSVFAQGSAAKKGHQVNVEVKPYQNQWIYLANYYGGIKTLADSAYLNAESKGVFAGAEPLPKGIYIVASPSKSILFEMVIDKQQHFSVSMDTTNAASTLKFTGSPENDAFIGYTRYMNPRAMRANEISSLLDSMKAGAEKTALTNEITAINTAIIAHRDSLINNDPEGLLAALFKVMKDQPLPASLRQLKTRADTMAAYRWGKEHYWDNIDFMDGRLVRTPVFEPKLSQYLEQWVSAEPDSIIAEFDWMIALGRNDPDMFRFIIGYYVDHYIYPKIMGQDKVFLHVYNKYLADDKPKMDWLNETQMKTIRDRAYMIMANQIGTTAWDMQLVDTLGKTRGLYDVKADYTIVAFWDVHCGKCKEEIPVLDSLYQEKWKKKNVQVYAVMVNEGSIADWKPYIQKHGMGWVHVHEPSALREKVEKEGKPNYRQLYDMRSTPTLFLLDKEKRIIAKNISLKDLDRVLDQKFAAPKSS